MSNVILYNIYTCVYNIVLLLNSYVFCYKLCIASSLGSYIIRVRISAFHARANAEWRAVGAR